MPLHLLIILYTINKQINDNNIDDDDDDDDDIFKPILLTCWSRGDVADFQEKYSQ